MMNKGLTLVELIITVALFSVMAMAMSWILVAGLQSWNSGRTRADLVQDSSFAVETMVREISQATSITDASADEIEFVADLDEDGTNETINFSVDSNNLIRTEATVAPIIAANVQTFALSYRDLDNTLLNLPQDTSSQTKRDKIRVIIISLTMNKGDDTFVLSSSVFARNQ